MTSSHPPRHGNTRYPWPVWTNGEPHWAKAKKDFHCSAEAFRRALYTHARRKRLVVTTRSERTTQRVWFLFRPSP
jgi:hypothetical protein